MADPNNALLISQDELREMHNSRMKEDIARDAVRFWHERDESREQLAAAQQRVAVLEAALREITEQFERVEPQYSKDKLIIAQARAALAGDK